MALAALIVATIAASISVLTFVWTIFWSVYEHRKRTRPELDVRADQSFMTLGPPVPLLGVQVTNVGQPAVTVEEIKVEVKGHELHMSLINWHHVARPLKVRLETGDTWSGFHLWDAITEGIANLEAQGRKVRVAARDSTGRLHRTKWRDWS